mgnify:CR=1 FL=1
MQPPYLPPPTGHRPGLPGVETRGRLEIELDDNHEAVEIMVDIEGDRDRAEKDEDGFNWF